MKSKLLYLSLLCGLAVFTACEKENIDVTTNEEEEVVPEVVVVSPLCGDFALAIMDTLGNGEALSADISGGTAPYDYTWSDGR